MLYVDTRVPIPASSADLDTYPHSWHKVLIGSKITFLFYVLHESKVGEWVFVIYDLDSYQSLPIVG